MKKIVFLFVLGVILAIQGGIILIGPPAAHSQSDRALHDFMRDLQRDLEKQGVKFETPKPKPDPWKELKQKIRKLERQHRYRELLELYQNKLSEAQRQGRLASQTTYSYRIADLYLNYLEEYAPGAEYTKKTYELIFRGEETDPTLEPDENFAPWRFTTHIDKDQKANWYRKRLEQVKAFLYPLLNNYKENAFLELIDWLLPIFEKRNDRNFQIELTQFAANVCIDLKDFSRGIKYAQTAYKLLEEGLDDPESIADDWIDNVRNEKYRRKEGWEERIKEAKIDWYKSELREVSTTLSRLYSMVGNHKLSKYYRKKSQFTREEGLKISRDFFLSSIENCKIQLSFEGQTWKRKKELKAEIKKFEQKIAEVDIELAGGESKKMKTINRIAKLQAAGDVEALRSILKKRVANGLKNPEVTKWGKNYTKREVYTMASGTAYGYGLYPEAYDYALKAIKAHKKSVPEYRQVLIDDQRKERRKSRRYAERPFNWDLIERIVRDYDRRFWIEFYWLIAGKSLRHMDRPKEAVKYLKKVYEYEGTLVQWVDSSGFTTKMNALEELGFAYEAAGMTDEAIQALSKLIDLLEEPRSMLTSSEQKIGYLGKHDEIYSRIIRMLVAEKRNAEALNYLERTRSRAFIDLLGGKALEPRNDKTQKLVAQKDRLDTDYAKLLKETTSADTSRQRGIEIYHKQISEVLADIKAEDPEFLSLSTVETLKASDIQKLLDNESVMIEYFITLDALYIWVIKRHSIQVEKVNVPIKVLAQKVADLREQIAAPREPSQMPATAFQSPQVFFEITPQKFKNGDEFTQRIIVKNNSSLFLTIKSITVHAGEKQRKFQILEKEIPPQEKRVVGEYTIEWTIVPTTHQAVVMSDHGELRSTPLNITIDSRMVSVTAKDDLKHKDDAENLAKYTAFNLYDLLIRPVKPHLDTNRLYIVPTGLLHFLPFTALEDRGRYLIEDYVISFMPSATVFKFCKEKTKKRGENILAFGNPDLKDPLLDIPFAAAEVKAIGSLYPSARILTGQEASEQTFKSMAAGYDTIHLACHGLFEPDSPMQSSLLLSPAGNEDGKLTMGEIFNLDLNADLVTLSACQSGMSTIRAGDEVMGLPRAFIYAGTPSVVSSLWNVNDKSTALLMAELYANLKQMNKARALRDAQLNLRGNDQYKHPVVSG